MGTIQSISSNNATVFVDVDGTVFQLVASSTELSTPLKGGDLHFELSDCVGLALKLATAAARRLLPAVTLSGATAFVEDFLTAPFEATVVSRVSKNVCFNIDSFDDFFAPMFEFTDILLQYTPPFHVEEEFSTPGPGQTPGPGDSPGRP